MKYIGYSSSRPSGPLQKVAAIVLTVGIAAAVLVFSSVFLVLLLLAAAIGGIWLWWKTRHVRRMMREMQGQMEGRMNQARTAFEAGGFQEGTFTRQGPFGQQGPFNPDVQSGGVIIEGEAVRVDEARERIRP
jgi:hypothetical protein